ncbi:MAG: hypothetical protein IPP60_16410 [Sphingobacteriales bacterium]|nr:hypothetical protein [Sphingobacteriales bacterium]
MFCSHCNTPFTILPLEEGKSKFCENCGQLIYKNENGIILTYQPEEVLMKQDNEHDLRERINREKETRFKEQLERKEKEKEFRERLEQERLIREQEELERKIKEKEEQDRLFQIQLEEERRLKERLLQIQQEKDRMELERYESELAEREQKLREQIIKEEEEKIQRTLAERELLFQQKLEAEQKERERLEKELSLYEKQRMALEEKLALEKKHFELTQKVRSAQEQERLSFLEKERKIKENLLLAQLENEKLERERLERDLLKSKETKTESIVLPVVAETSKKEEVSTVAAISNEIPENSSFSSAPVVSNKKTGRLILSLVILSGILITLFLLRDKLPFFNKKTEALTVATNNSFTSIDVTAKNADAAFIEQLKSDINGKEILSWNPVNQEEIKEITLLSGSQNGQQINYEATINLEDKTGTKAKTETILHFENNALQRIETTKITYINIAPVRAWFSFAPVPNCTITVNTNNNPIQLKTCDACAIQKMVSDSNNPVALTNASKISIKSDNRYDGLVEFTYVPVK